MKTPPITVFNPKSVSDPLDYLGLGSVCIIYRDELLLESAITASANILRGKNDGKFFRLRTHSFSEIDGSEASAAKILDQALHAGLVVVATGDAPLPGRLIEWLSNSFPQFEGELVIQGAVAEPSPPRNIVAHPAGSDTSILAGVPYS